MINRTPLNLELFDSLPLTERNLRFRHEIKRVRSETSRWLREKLKDSGYSYQDVAMATGSDKTAFSRMLHNEFGVPFEGLHVLCNFYLNCSCSELLMAENWDISLPRWLNSALLSYERMDNDSRRSVEQLVVEYQKISEDNPQELTHAALTYRRICECCDDKNILLGLLVQTNESRGIRPVLMSMLETKEFTARLSSFMYLCCYLKYSPDFFIEADYSTKTKLKLNSSCGDDRFLTKEETEFISSILKVNYDLQTELVGKILAIGIYRKRMKRTKV